MDLVLFILFEKCCLTIRFFVLNTPKYLKDSFTGIFSITNSLQLCKDKIAHLVMFSLSPEALEN